MSIYNRTDKQKGKSTQFADGDISCIMQNPPFSFASAPLIFYFMPIADTIRHNAKQKDQAQKDNTVEPHYKDFIIRRFCNSTAAVTCYLLKGVFWAFFC